MPKVNVPPSSVKTFEPTLVKEEVKKPVHEETKKEGFVWDFKFSFGLIILVVAVNTILALLLGKSANMSDSSAMRVFAEPQQEQRSIPLTKSPASLQALSPAAGAQPTSDVHTTRTYITPEDKRLLLKYLETPPDQKLPATTISPAQPNTNPQ